MPLRGYAALLVGYSVIFGTVLGVWARRGLPRRVSARDIALLGVATHKVARLVAKDWVTSPIRAPFTEYVESTGGGEVAERARGRGVRRAVGDLLTCPWCLAPWVAGGLYRHVRRPASDGAADRLRVQLGGRLRFPPGSVRQDSPVIGTSFAAVNPHG